MSQTHHWLVQNITSAFIQHQVVYRERKFIHCSLQIELCNKSVLRFFIGAVTVENAIPAAVIFT